MTSRSKLRGHAAAPPDRIRMPYGNAVTSNDDAGSAGQPTDPVFIPGLELSSALYTEIVAPLLAEAYPNLRYSAALIGTGSEILGYDTARSTDHEWGPRLLLFLGMDEYDRHAAAIRATLRDRLPPRFRGYSTHFSDRTATDSRVPRDAAGGPINHKVEIWTVGGF